MTNLLFSFAGTLAQGDISSVQIHSVWDFVIKGGPIMIPIGLCSLVALAIIVERALSLRRKRVVPPAFMAGLKGLSADPRRAIEYCNADGSPIANIMAAALKRRGEPEAVVEKAVADAGRREIIRLRKYTRVLSALPQVSTMLGLLGTIFGMIKTFQAVATSGQALGKTEMLAKGIFEAWTATAAGLLVAIPVLVAYHAIMGRVDAAMVELDRTTTDWFEQERANVTRPATSGAAREIVAPAQPPAPSPSIDPNASAPAGAVPATA